MTRRTTFFADAIVPLFPGETTLTTASVAASDGTLGLAGLITSLLVGGVYWIDRYRRTRDETSTTAARVPS